MTREQAKEFIQTTFGTEATDEMISAYLNSLNGAIKSEKDRADKLKADASMVEELKAKLEQMESANMTEVEKANSETQKANEQVAKLTRQIKAMETKTRLAELGITGEDANNLFTEDGMMNFDVLGKIISERETTASSAKEKEILAKTPNPSGSAGKGEEKSESEVLAENIGKAMSETNKKANDVLANYLN